VKRTPSERWLLIILFPLLLVSGRAIAQEPGSRTNETPKVTYGFETDFNSRYVWRGIAQSAGPVKQMTAWVSISGFTFHAWGNMPLGREPQRGNFNQGEFSVSYTGEWKKLAIEPAFLFYLNRSSDNVDSPPTGEVSVKVSYPAGPLRVFTEHSFDYIRYRSAYFGQAGLSNEVRLNRKTTVASELKLGWGSAKFNETNIGVPKRAFNLIGAEVSLTHSLSHRFYLRPHFEFTQILDGRLRRHLASPTIGAFGLALSINL
jgi:hypothetical protein